MLMISSRLVDSNLFIIVIRLELSSILSADGTSVKTLFFGGIAKQSEVLASAFSLALLSLLTQFFLIS
jgi:hypothetical protein